MSVKTIEAFLNNQNETIKDLYQSVLTNHWMAATTGDQKWSEQHEKALNTYFSHFASKELMDQVSTFRSTQRLKNKQQRQLDDIYRKMIKNQLGPESQAKTLELEKEISQTFTTFRPNIHGKEVTNNEIKDILKTSSDLNQRKEAWFASKQIGKKIEAKVLRLIQKRNEDARALGFDNFYQMSYETQELDINDVFHILEGLKEQSDGPFQVIKHEMDEELAKKWGVSTSDIRPWHYTDPFFQEAPPVQGLDIDTYFLGKNIKDIANQTFQSMGLEIEDVLNRSDLYPRDNKNPFGFCSDINREGDVRILVNLDESLFWCTALLHELGHAVYFKNIDRKLPFILRFHSHTLTTEAIALFFGRMSKMGSWQKRFLTLKSNQLEELKPFTNKMLQRQMLVSARWIITFSFFERELYENPNQNLNQLWWKLVQDIQFMHPPEQNHFPDWAAKMHFSLAPASYQDYLLGELTASQLHCFIEKNISNDLFTEEVGSYLIREFINPGASLHWNEKIKKATGEYLNPRYFIKQFF
ncbi:gluzincin family metallopeptidase [Alkalihalobacterium elongatum]|uniref:peptidase M3A and M3B thimet/oligopeptidase F n=1 Tax=Alkalihalobacterium elongatum TaxID=2675466 RepID=UPI001C1FC94A|nr:peptidase M3A and M3B thimet/oligopeptidase F [Alkalihalobacterium elongatum]